MSVRIGLVGYGVGGRLFHLPYLQASDAVELVGVVTRSGARAEALSVDSPGTPVYRSLGELIDAGVDAVVISTPPQTRRALVVEAISRGVHVVADKPFAPTAVEGAELARLAAEAGVVLNVFHNRRRDTDIVTALRVIDGGELGRLQRLDLRCEQDDPASVEAGPAGGLLRDLGSHVVDQALLLLGPASRVTAHLVWVDLAAGRTDAAFWIGIEHVGGAFSSISSTKIHGLASRELRLMGEKGSYVSDYSDVQYEAIAAGRRPADDRTAWGIEDPTRWGRLSVGGETRLVPSAQGDYTGFYDDFAAAVVSGGAGPVPAAQGVATLRVLDAARVSAAEHRTVAV